MRKGPSTAYEKVGSLKTNDEVTVTGQADNGWYRISYNGGDAFVSNNYLGTEKVTVPVAPTVEKPSTPPASSEKPVVTNPNAPSRTLSTGVVIYNYRNTYNGIAIYEVTENYWPQYIFDAVDACCTSNMTDMEKCSAIHDYLCKRLRYDDEEGRISTTKETFATNRAICGGFANSFQSMMCAVGIETDVVIGNYNGGTPCSHAWNRSLIDGVYYYNDVTHDGLADSEDFSCSRKLFTDEILNRFYVVAGYNMLGDVL